MGSLSPSERRYVRLKLKAERRGGISNLEELFELLCRQLRAGGPSTRDVLAASRFAGHVSETRYQLYRRILDWLQAYHQGQQLEATLQQQLQQVSLLYERGMHVAAYSLLRKSWSLAVAGEQFLHQLQVITWVRRLISVDMVAGDEAAEWLQHEARTLLQLNNLHSMQTLYLRTTQSASKVEYVRCKEDQVQLEALFAEVLLPKQSMAQSESARLYELKLLAIYYRATVEFESLGRVAGELLERLQRRPELREQFPDLLIDVHIDLAYVACFFGRGEALVEVMTMMEALRFRNPWHRQRLYSVAMLFRVNICSFFGNFNTGTVVSEHLNRRLTQLRYVQSDYRKFFGAFNAAHCAFGEGDLKACLRHLGAAFALGQAVTRLNLFYMAQVLFLIVHFELGNTGLLPYAMRSLYRNLKRSNRLFEFESHVLAFLRRQLGRNAPSLRAGLRELHDLLLPLRESRFEVMSLLSFDIVAWLESKLDGGKFTDLVRQKASPQAVKAIDDWARAIHDAPLDHLIEDLIRE